MKLDLRIATCCTLLSMVPAAMSETAVYPESGPYGNSNLPQPHYPGQMRDYPSGTMEQIAQAGRYRPAPATRYSDSTYYPPRGGNYPEGFEPYTWRQQPENHRFRPWSHNDSYPGDGDWRFRSQPSIDYPGRFYQFQQYQPRQQSFPQPYFPNYQWDPGYHQPQTDWGYGAQPYQVPSYQQQAPQDFGYPYRYQEPMPYPEAYMPYQEYMPHREFMPHAEHQIPVPGYMPYQEHWGGSMDPYYGMDWNGDYQTPPPMSQPGFPQHRGSQHKYPYPMLPGSGDWSSSAPEQTMPSSLPGEPSLDQLPLPTELDAGAAQSPPAGLAESDTPAAAVEANPSVSAPANAKDDEENLPVAAPEAPAEAQAEEERVEESAAASDSTEPEKSDAQPQTEDHGAPAEEPAEAKET